MTTRTPAVAGQFYPSDQRVLERTIHAHLDGARPGHSRPEAIVMPHAGYVFSGPIAASAAAPLAARRNEVRRAIVIGPSHRVPVRGVALTSAAAFRTPLGDVPVDVATVAELARRPGVRMMDAAHKDEHSIEVELPFLQVLLGDFPLMPLVIGDSNPAEVADLLEELCSPPDTLLVVSTDLSHFLEYNAARARDARTAAAIEARAGKRIDWDDACGRDCLRAALILAVRRGWTVTTVDLRNSGDTAGDHKSVVGYGAWHLGIEAAP